MAEYTKLTESQIEEVLVFYGLEYQTSKHLDGGAANTSYRVDTVDGDAYTLTVLDHDGNLPAEMLTELLVYLDSYGVSSTKPVANKQGGFLSVLGEHRILLKRYIDGTCYSVLPQEHLGAVGAALAKLHTVPIPDWLPADTRRLGDVSEMLERFEDQEFAAWVSSHLQSAQPLFRLDAKRCVVHGDIAADNLVVQHDGAIGLLDWETTSIDTAAMDLGFAIVGIANVKQSLDVQRVDAFLAGYETERTIPIEESAFLKDAVIYAGVRTAYFRYVRQHIRFPNPAKFHLYKEMRNFVDSIDALWRP